MKKDLFDILSMKIYFTFKWTTLQCWYKDKSLSNLSKKNSFSADCGAPPQIDRAIVGDGKTTEGAIRTYTCQGQTVTEGSPKIRCEQTGVWSTSTLNCRREYLNYFSSVFFYTNSTVELVSQDNMQQKYSSFWYKPSLTILILTT